MGESTKIQWTGHTFNLAWGCTKVSAGCKHCYAEKDANRYGHDVWGPDKPRRTFGEKHWNEPKKWDRAARAAGVKRLVFTSSMADVFEDHPTIDEERVKLWKLIRETPNLTWQIVTKRPERIQANLPEFWEEIRDRVWLLTSIEDQATADLRIPLLLQVAPRPAVFGVSAEPLLGPVDLDECGATPCAADGGIPGVVPEPRHHAGIDWCIVGGESGPNARAFWSHWVWEFQKACELSGIALFVKQFGKHCVTWGHVEATGGDWPNGSRLHVGDLHQPYRVQFKHPKGGDPDEWPAWARIRQFPAGWVR